MSFTFPRLVPSRRNTCAFGISMIFPNGPRRVSLFAAMPPQSGLNAGMMMISFVFTCWYCFGIFSLMNVVRSQHGSKVLYPRRSVSMMVGCVWPMMRRLQCMRCWFGHRCPWMNPMSL